MSECAMELTGGSCVYAVTLPPDNGSVPVARHTAGAVLASWGLEDYVDVAGLLLSELVTNAIQHSGGAREFVLVYLVPRSGLLHVEVHDHCSTVPVPRQAKINEENGRGCELPSSGGHLVGVTAPATSPTSICSLTTLHRKADGAMTTYTAHTSRQQGESPGSVRCVILSAHTSGAKLCLRLAKC
jgi:anti-sigma regulatory factor (Ser/Thr protein kinase)